ncbi:MAG TPA: dephospho-CoA kinase, partial [Candidatus Angelobacter sp.]|nr:dephospho-CoA kinase [Candidatus Angelobacter sp.]
PVVDADVASRKVVEPGQPALIEIIDVFGSGVIQADGTLDRKKLGAVIFGDEDKRKMLNAIVHPRVREWMQVQIKGCEEMGENAIVLDIPLLIESQLKSWADKVLLVYVPKAIQIERLMTRDQISEDEALLRIHSQMPLDEKKAYADRVIDNQGSLQDTREQLLTILGEWGIGN